jgi:hypothetical protein
MFAGIFLLRKGKKLNQMAIQAITNAEDIFGLQGWGEFAKNSNHCKEILSTLKDDEQLYSTLLKHLQKKLEEEVGDKKKIPDVIHFINSDEITVIALNSKIKSELSGLMQFWGQLQKSGSSLARDYGTALCHMYVSLENEKELPFLDQNHIFDWKEFEGCKDDEFTKKFLPKVTQMF